jgi:uncharacterized protein
LYYFWITLLVFGIFLLLMAIGVILSDIRLRGSCGGLNKLTGDDCDFCDNEDESECQSLVAKAERYICHKSGKETDHPCTAEEDGEAHVCDH